MSSRIQAFLIFSLIVALLPALAARTSMANAETVVFVHPEKMTVKVNATFQISVNVSGASKLQGFDLMLSYDTRLLDCLSLEEGTFLASFGPTFVAKHQINDSLTGSSGRVWFAACIYGTGFADGNGTLAVVTFKAVAAGQTVLDLYSEYPYRPDTLKLTTCSSEPIPNRAVDGLVIVVVSEDNDPNDPPPKASGFSNSPPSPDINGDGIVNIQDLALIGVAFGTVDGDLKYNIGADLDLNGVVDIRDVAVAASNYNRKI